MGGGWWCLAATLDRASQAEQWPKGHIHLLRLQLYSIRSEQKRTGGGKEGWARLGGRVRGQGLDCLLQDPKCGLGVLARFIAAEGDLKFRIAQKKEIQWIEGQLTLFLGRAARNKLYFSFARPANPSIHPRSPYSNTHAKKERGPWRSKKKN